jgi:hypothetical protein
MEQKNSNRRMYEPPRLTVVELRTERGFAGSNENRFFGSNAWGLGLESESLEARDYGGSAWGVSTNNEERQYGTGAF